jgi:MobA-like NTP transferase domain
MLRVIISAAGSARRWRGHLGRPKHLIQIPPGGETMLRRTVRIVRDFGADDVVITAPMNDPPGLTYETEGARLFRKPNVQPRDRDNHYRQADRFLPRELWNTEGRTLILAGDFFYCRKTLKNIVAYDPGTWVLYGRIHNTKWPPDDPNGMTRTRMVLGFGFPPQEHDLVMDGIEKLTAMQRDPDSPVKRSVGLDLYRYLCGQTPEELGRTGGPSGKGRWENVPPHLWQPPKRSVDMDFDNPETYGGFMLHYKPDLHN